MAYACPMPLQIRPAISEDRRAIWKILEPTIRAAETYTLPGDMKEADALAYWLSPNHEVFVAEEDGEVVATYYLRPNQQGPGSHIANCGYITAPGATGRGNSKSHVPTFARSSEGSGLPGHAIQLRGEHQHGSGVSLADARVSNRRRNPRGLSASRQRPCLGPHDVSQSVAGVSQKNTAHVHLGNAPHGYWRRLFADTYRNVIQIVAMSSGFGVVADCVSDRRIGSNDIVDGLADLVH
jgi:hypothetical protein